MLTPVTRYMLLNVNSCLNLRTSLHLSIIHSDADEQGTRLDMPKLVTKKFYVHFYVVLRASFGAQRKSQGHSAKSGDLAFLPVLVHRDQK